MTLRVRAQHGWFVSALERLELQLERLKHGQASVAGPLPSYGFNHDGWTRAGGPQTAFLAYLGLGVALN